MLRAASKPQLIIGPDKIPAPFVSHLQAPTPYFLNDGSLGLMVACRTNKNQSYTVLFILDPKTLEILESASSPILDLGLPGAFDSSGIMPSHVTFRDGQYQMFYIGWNVPNDVPFHNAIGLATSSDGRSFTRFSDGPILDRNLYDPYYVSTPFVFAEGPHHRMFYISGRPWFHAQGKLQSSYCIKEAQSTDGIHFIPNSEVSVAPAEGEWAVARPWIWRSKTTGQLQMLFCARRETYSLFSAIQLISGLWERAPLLEPDGFQNSLLSTNLAYPALVELGDRKLVFCNGDGFGKTGVLAFQVEES